VGHGATLLPKSLEIGIGSKPMLSLHRALAHSPYGPGPPSSRIPTGGGDPSAAEPWGPCALPWFSFAPEIRACACGAGLWAATFVLA